MRPIESGVSGEDTSFQLRRKRDVLARALPFLIVPIPVLVLLIKLGTIYDMSKIKPHDMLFPKEYVIAVLVASCVSIAFGIFAFLKSFAAFSRREIAQDLRAKSIHENDNRKWINNFLISILFGIFFTVASALAFKNIKFGKGMLSVPGILTVMGSLIFVMWLLGRMAKAIYDGRKAKDPNASSVSASRNLLLLLDPVVVKNFKSGLNGDSTKQPDSFVCEIKPSTPTETASVIITMDGTTYYLQPNAFARETNLNARIGDDATKVDILNGDILLSKDETVALVITRGAPLKIIELKGTLEKKMIDLKQYAIQKERECLAVQSKEGRTTERPDNTMRNAGYNIIDLRRRRDSVSSN